MTFFETVKPRYVRVNTLKISLDDACSGFKEDGWNELECPSTYSEYLQLIKEHMFTEEYVFVKDFHINNMLVFPSCTLFFDNPAYLNGYVVLQDKASCLFSSCISIKPGSVILDMCAAPGMKTSLMASCINNVGQIYAVEKHPKRFEVMQKLLHPLEVTCVEFRNCDAGSVGPADCKDVKYILVDPSCSGEGMTSRIEEIKSDRYTERNVKERLQKLSNLQSYLLRHAICNFPSAKYVIYSTCSLEEEENEAVVESVLRCAKFYGFSLINIKKKLQGWKNFGSDKYECGNRCIYSQTNSDYTNGGFLAIFKRKFQNDLSNYEVKLDGINQESTSDRKKVKLSKLFFALVNTLKISVEDAIQHFVDNDWKYLPAPCNYDVFLTDLQEGSQRVKDKFFKQDFHIKELFIFPMGVVDNIPKQFVKSNHLIAFDKVSCLAVQLLDPFPGCTVIDMCAGLERSSLSIAARMNNEGCIYAFEENEGLYKNLMSELKASDISCVYGELHSGLYSSSKNCPGAQLILVSPPSSGSDLGGVRRGSTLTQSENVEGSLRTYTVIQFSLLKHALTEFPKATRVVYCTRSVYPEENEEIIDNLLVVAKFNGFKLVNARKKFFEWQNNCNSDYYFVTKCLVSRDVTSINKGFFIAIFERESGFQVNSANYY